MTKERKMDTKKCGKQREVGRVEGTRREGEEVILKGGKEGDEG